LSLPADDEHVSAFDAPTVDLAWNEDEDDDPGEDQGDDPTDVTRVGAHGRRIGVPEIEEPRHPLPDRPRYFLSCSEPSGDYDAVIVAVTDGDRRRYFTTRDGERLTEVDDHSFDQRPESGGRLMLELDERELAELEVELQFVRPVRGRDPIAEAGADADADAAADADAVADVDADPDAAADLNADEVETEDNVEDPVTEAFDESPTPTAALEAAEAIAQVALAKGIAFIAHRGQHDRTGAPYIDHPGRIAERFDPETEPVEAAAAWLHDVLEDSPITAQELFEAGVVPDVIDVVRTLTRGSEADDDEYYDRIRRDPVARRVKLADIDDNTARWRLRRLDYDVQLHLVEKYRLARLALGAD
jgi:hypothetical protein